MTIHNTEAYDAIDCFADTSCDIYYDDNTGLTHYPDGSVKDLVGCVYYPGDDLYDAFTLDYVTSDAYIDSRF